MGKTEEQQAVIAAGSEDAGEEPRRRLAKFEIFGEEMIEKRVRQSGRSGRVYLPPEWVGKNIKIIRIH